MSDSFADLWSSLEPAKQPAKPSTLGAASKLQTTATSTQSRANDAFSILASASSSSSRPASRSLTPSLSLQPQRPLSSQSQAKPSSQRQGGNNGDAFGSLLSASFSTSNNPGNLSLAARQEVAMKEQQARLERERLEKAKEADAWSGLDLLAQGNSKPAPSTNSVASDKDDWLFDKPSLPPSSSYPTPPEDDLLLSPATEVAPPAVKSRSSQAQPPKASTASSTSLFDILSDDFSSSSHASSYPGAAKDSILQSHTPTPGRDRSSPAIRSRPNSPGDFDFGDREDHLLNGSGDSGSEGEGGDDILGMLAKPVESIPKRRISPTQSASQTPASRTAQRSSSPPPHIIGQIVEMGFSPEQARLALAATDSGLDVQQALEMLLSNGAGSTEHNDMHLGNGRAESRSRIRSEDEDVQDLGPRTRTRDDAQRPPMRRQASGSARNQPYTQAQASSSLVPGELQERADKLISQASEIGLSVFSRANAFWKEGKERVQKVYEERASSGHGGVKGRSPADGRPRWMIDAQAAGREGGEESVDRSVNSGFKDSEETDGEEAILGAMRGHRQPDVRKDVQARDNSSASGSAGPGRPPRTANLLDDEPATYVSPSRRRNAAARAPSQPSLSTSRQTTRVPSPEPLRTREAIPASPSTIAVSNNHKAKGTELFKLGQYADAEKAYASALDALPANHLLLVPLHNNRAVTRLKTGDHAGAIEDCTAVLAIVGPSYHPAREAKVSKAEEGAAVDLADAVVKAYRRRAEAYEGREKWAEAQRDWEAIVGCEWAVKARSDALNGIARCKKMISSERDPAPKTRTAPPPRRASPPTAQTFEAVQKLREANKALEAEDAERMELKDTVDARLLAWRGGKETNLRALLASLEAVLWPGLGWQKVGMHELVTPGQVKVRYMKAIAKLHPDKLNVSNTTLEQRMIANGVFAALNDAWLTFKQ